MGNSASLSSLPYTIGEEQKYSSGIGIKGEKSLKTPQNGWAIHEGKRKSDGMPVCVFKGSKPQLIQSPATASSAPLRNGSDYVTIGKKDRVDTNSLLLPAFRHFSKSKTLVHPNLIKVYATLDTDASSDAAPASGGTGNTGAASTMLYANSGTAGDLIVVTEQVVPLHTWLEQERAKGGQGDDARMNERIAWGIVGMVKALTFLHTNARMAHGAVCKDSVFVTPGGDFKLGNYSLLTDIGNEGPNVRDSLRYFGNYEEHLCPLSYRCPERISGDYEALVQTFPPHAIDSFSLGQLMEELYYPAPLPDKLVKAVARLKAVKAQQRPRVQPLLRCPVLDTPHVKSMDFLSEINVKSAEEKIAYLQSIPNQLDHHVLSKEALVHKLLPSIQLSLQNIAGNPAAISQDVNRREVMVTIVPVFLVGDALSDEEFQKVIAPLVSTLFQLNDRGVRAAMLSRLGSIVSRLDNTYLNAQVFEPICTGFSDSSAALRELTLKSTLPLIPHLNSLNLEKLGRYLVRLQSDTQNSIRTNTVIFISKIAPSLSGPSRSKLLLPAFVRALKDPFDACRLAALKSILSCRECFDPKAVATQVLPCVVPHLMDSTAIVRKEAFTVMKEFMSALEETSHEMEQVETLHAPTSGQSNFNRSESNLSADQQQQQQQQQQQEPVVPVPPSSQGSTSYLSGFTSWMTTQAKGDDVIPQAVQPQPADSIAPPPPAAAAASVDTYALANEPAMVASDSGDGGWSDNEDDLALSPVPTTTKTPGVGFASNRPIPPPPPSQPTSNANGDTSVEDFFSSSMVGSRRPKSRPSPGNAASASPSASKLLLSANSTRSQKQSSNKNSLADLKADFAQRKMDRQKSKPKTGGGVGSSGALDGWEDF